MKYNGIEKYIFADVYNFMLAYLYGDGSDVYWEAVMIDARALRDKYKGNKLCGDMLIAVLNNLEFKYSNNKDENGRTYLDYQMLNSGGLYVK